MRRFAQLLISGVSAPVRMLVPSLSSSSRVRDVSVAGSAPDIKVSVRSSTAADKRESFVREHCLVKPSFL
jgi:hypothetical protein